MTLKANSKKILDIIATQPNLNQTQAYKQVHPTASDNTARNNSSQLLKKPEAQIYLQKHIEKAKTKVVQLIDSDNEQISLKASEAVLDRALGKATQQISSTTQSISFSIDLSSALKELETGEEVD